MKTAPPEKQAQPRQPPQQLVTYPTSPYPSPIDYGWCYGEEPIRQGGNNWRD